MSPFPILYVLRNDGNCRKKLLTVCFLDFVDASISTVGVDDKDEILSYVFIHIDRHCDMVM